MENRTKEASNISKFANSSCPSSKSTSTHHHSSLIQPGKGYIGLENPHYRLRYKCKWVIHLLIVLDCSFYIRRTIFYKRGRFNYFDFLITVMQIRRYIATASPWDFVRRTNGRFENQAINKLIWTAFLFFHARFACSLRCVVLCDVRNKKMIQTSVLKSFL